MKTNKLFRVDSAKADVVYSVFKSCNVFTLVLNGEFIPVYDFSGNNFRSSLNTLRKYYPGSRISFYCKTSFEFRTSLPPYLRESFPNCILFF